MRKMCLDTLATTLRVCLAVLTDDRLVSLLEDVCALKGGRISKGLLIGLPLELVGFSEESGAIY